MPQATGLQFTARVGDLPPDHFAVVGFELTERLSDLADGHLELASRDPAVAPETVLEQPVELVMLDIRLPGKDGCLISSGANKKHRIPIANTSGNANGHDCIRQSDSGAATS